MTRDKRLVSERFPGSSQYHPEWVLANASEGVNSLWSENAHGESFFHSLTADLAHGRQFQTGGELRQQLRRSLRYSNHQRLHSSLGYRSPVDYERGAA